MEKGQRKLLEFFYGMSVVGGVGVRSGTMLPELSFEHRASQVVERKVGRSMELQGKEIQREETIYKRIHITAWCVRTTCPLAF